MRVYHFHPASGDYLGAEDADPDPMNPGEFLIPAHSTLIEPPACERSEMARFDPEARQWRIERKGIEPAALDELARRLDEAGSLIDHFSDLAALGRLDEAGIDYLMALRVYRVELRALWARPGFPDIEWPAPLGAPDAADAKGDDDG